MSTTQARKGTWMGNAAGWLFRSRSTGRITIAQWPNLPLWLFIAASALRRVFDPHGTAGAALDLVALVALGWWAVAEIVRGVNPFRRMLGAVVLIVAVGGLLLR